MIDNRLMEVLIALAVLAQVGFQSFLIYKLYEKSNKPKPNKVVHKRKKAHKPVTQDTQDVYSPMYAENTVPLDEFMPNFSKDIKIIRQETEDDKDQITEMN